MQYNANLKRNCLRVFTMTVFLILCFVITPDRAVKAEEIYRNSVTGYRAVIDDTAGLISDEDPYYGKLTEEMQVLTEYGNAALLTVSEGYIESTRDYAKSNLHSLFGKESATVFLIDLVNRQIYVFSNGDILKTVTQSRGIIITDNIYRYATLAQYTECACHAFEQEIQLLEGSEIAQPMKYISCILLALLFAGFIVYENARKHSAGSVVDSYELLKYTEHNLGVKVKINNLSKTKYRHDDNKSDSVRSSGSWFSSDDSSGGSWGGGSSGGSGGGGGGHSF